MISRAGLTLLVCAAAAAAGEATPLRERLDLLVKESHALRDPALRLELIAWATGLTIAWRSERPRPPVGRPLGVSGGRLGQLIQHCLNAYARPDDPREADGRPLPANGVRPGWALQDGQLVIGDAGAIAKEIALGAAIWAPPASPPHQDWRNDAVPADSIVRLGPADDGWVRPTQGMVLRDCRDGAQLAIGHGADLLPGGGRLLDLLARPMPALLGSPLWSAESARFVHIAPHADVGMDWLVQDYRVTRDGGDTVSLLCCIDRLPGAATRRAGNVWTAMSQPLPTPSRGLALPLRNARCPVAVEIEVYLGRAFLGHVMGSNMESARSKSLPAGADPWSRRVQRWSLRVAPTAPGQAGLVALPAITVDPGYSDRYAAFPDPVWMLRLPATCALPEPAVQCNGLVAAAATAEGILAGTGASEVILPPRQSSCWLFIRSAGTIEMRPMVRDDAAGARLDLVLRRWLPRPGAQDSVTCALLQVPVPSIPRGGRMALHLAWENAQLGVGDGIYTMVTEVAQQVLTLVRR